MSDSNLHTCERAALGWQKEGPCKQCELEDNFAKFGGNFGGKPVPSGKQDERERPNVELLSIPAEGTLDSVTVFWQNWNLGQGQVTIVCWGSAWTAYFGGMGKETIQEFFRTAYVDYLVNKLQCAQWQKRTKQHEKYLTRIVEAVKKAMVA